MRYVTVLLLVVALACGPMLLASDSDVPVAAAPGMSNVLLERILKRLDPDLQGKAPAWVLTIEGIAAQVVTDEHADRMRIMIPVDRANQLDAEALYRLLQADFESALDARYAVAQEMVWSAFIHPLSPLSEAELVSAVAQTFNAAATYGSSFSSGAFSYGGGDHQGELFDRIIERGDVL